MTDAMAQMRGALTASIEAAATRYADLADIRAAERLRDLADYVRGLDADDADLRAMASGWTADTGGGFLDLPPWHAEADWWERVAESASQSDAWRWVLAEWRMDYPSA